MKKLSLILAAGAMAAPVAAHAQASDCGDVSITEMNWASAQVVTAVANFIMTQGYGCNVSVVSSDTIPAVTSVAENGEPDIVTELWLNSTGDTYNELRDSGRVVEAGPVLDPGGVEGWWIPTYLAEEHPELTTIEGILANPDLVGGRSSTVLKAGAAAWSATTCPKRSTLKATGSRFSMQGLVRCWQAPWPMP